LLRNNIININSKKIFLITEDTTNCIPYIKKSVTKILTNNDDDNTRTAGLLKQITIKIGAKIMIKRNIDATLGHNINIRNCKEIMCNGTIVTI